MIGDGDTIAAPITGPGGAVAVLRLSGPDVRKALQELSSDASRIEANPRKSIYSAVIDPAEGAALDRALFTFFPAPGSFTGEDVLEVSLHGSPYILNRTLELLAERGVRPARAGEFTERAFRNGKMDLAQAEAIADLVAAETQAQARVAREQLEGRLSHAISDLGEPLRDLLAEIEAGIDFPDEDIDPATSEQWLRALGSVRLKLSRYIDSYRTGRICRDGAQVVLAGLPNAGKSSLLNRIVGDERAIVTPIAGTTRDSIEERIMLSGLYLRLWDTAGLAIEGYKPDEVERIGIEHSWRRIRNADLVLYVFDRSRSITAEKALLREVAAKAPRTLFVANKSDLSLSGDVPAAIDGIPVIAVSAESGDGIAELKQRLVAELIDGDEVKNGSLLICNERHKNALSQCDELLREAVSSITARQPAELTAQSLRSALHALNEIIGVTSVDDILGRIFSKFCIGK